MAQKVLPIGNIQIAPSSGAIAMTIIIITPELAATYVAANCPNNRRPREPRIEAMRRAMEEGRWKLTHQGIAFDSRGRLIDGQHRMIALSRCRPGTAIAFCVFQYTTTANAMSVFDDTAKRTAADGLVLLGRFSHTAAPAHAAVVGNIIRYTDGLDSVDNDLVSAGIDSYGEDVEWVLSVGVSRYAAVRAAFAYAYPVNKAAVAQLATRIANNDALEPGSAAHQLHKAIVGVEANRYASGPDKKRANIFFRVLQGIMHHLEGNAIGDLKGSVKGGRPKSLDYFRDRRIAIGLPAGGPGK